ncbi:MAG: hypothetical protein ABFS02_03540 [Pseudomonadota bacterium]
METVIRLSAAALTAFICAASAARADSVVDYVLERGGNHPGIEHRQALIKNGRLYVKGADGSSNKDLLYDRNVRTFWLIDHPKRRFYQVNEQTLLQWSRQGRALVGAAQTLARQFNLDLPAEWRGSAATPMLRYVQRGEKRVNDIPCRRYDIVDGNQKTGEICMTDGKRLDILRDDYETLLSLKQFIVKASNESAGIVASFGINLPQLGNADMSGIPVEISSTAVQDFHRIRLSNAASATIRAAVMGIPRGYVASDLPLPRMP